jgi:NADPH-dependent 2,4-dienoyl-CoA reductase/sulfur reductase-like enzyme
MTTSLAVTATDLEKTKVQRISNPDLLVVGAGPAGLSAAIAAKQSGVRQVLVVDREKEAGGILNQCIHAGFGLFQFGEALTGPEYADRLLNEALALDVEFCLETFVVSLKPTLETEVFSTGRGHWWIKPKSIVLAMGCRERTRAAVAVPGTRPAGVYSAGTAQRLINVEGYVLGRQAIIVGSGDIGLIMARRLTLEGVKVVAVIEIRDTPSGLPRNVAQCLKAFSIPLYLKHRVASIEGHARVEGVWIEPVAGGSRQYLNCDHVLFSVGLIPENELSAMAGATLVGQTNGLVLDSRMQTSVPGLFACGNAYHVYDLVDEAAREALRAGKFAARYISNLLADGVTSDLSFKVKKVGLSNVENHSRQVFLEHEIENGWKSKGSINGKDDWITCVICPKGCRIQVDKDGQITGYGCERGLEFTRQEIEQPSRMLTGTVAIKGALWPRLPCKTLGEIPENKLSDAAAALRQIVANAPIEVGEILCEDLGGTGIPVIATKRMDRIAIF